MAKKRKAKRKNPRPVTLKFQVPTMADARRVIKKLKRK